MRSRARFSRKIKLAIPSIIMVILLLLIFLDIPLVGYDIQGKVNYRLEEVSYLKITLYRASIGSLFEATLGGNRSYNKTDVYISIDGNKWYYLGSFNITPNREIKPELTLRIPVSGDGPFKIFVRDTATESMTFAGVVGPYSADMIYETYLYIGYLIGEIEKSYRLNMMIDYEGLNNPDYIQPVLRVKHLNEKESVLQLDLCSTDLCVYNFTQSNVDNIDIMLKVGYGPIEFRGDIAAIYLYLTDNIPLSILLVGLTLAPIMYEAINIRKERKRLKKLRYRRYRKKKVSRR